MGLELGTSGITSPGDFIESGFDPMTAAKLDAAFAEHNPEVIWTDNAHQGYVRVVLSRDEGLASFIAMSNIRSQRYTARTVSEWRMVRGDAGLDLVQV